MAGAGRSPCKVTELASIRMSHVRTIQPSRLRLLDLTDLPSSAVATEPNVMNRTLSKLLYFRILAPLSQSKLLFGSIESRQSLTLERDWLTSDQIGSSASLPVMLRNLLVALEADVHETRKIKLLKQI